jgi:NADH-quinone oxidoreductase subunit G
LDWNDALAHAAEALKQSAAEKIGVLASPSVTTEEAHLLARVAGYLGTANIDHRISRRDFSDQENDPLFPWLGCDIADIEKKNAIFVIGSKIRSEVPILAHRLRKAALAGADISFANSKRHEYFFDVHAELSGSGLVELLAGVAVAAAGKTTLPSSVAKLCKNASVSDEQSAIATSLKTSNDALILLGGIATSHLAHKAVTALAACIADLTASKLGYVSAGANAAGAHLAGLLPHRAQGGMSRHVAGLDAALMLDRELDAVVLANIEPDSDLLASGDAVTKLTNQKFVIALTPYASDSLLEAADLLLPIGTFAETSGTYINVAGTWQSFSGIANPVGESRPAWKVLRVLGNLLGAPDFDYVTSEDVLNEFKQQLGDIHPDNGYSNENEIAKPNGADAPAGDVETPIYSVDSMVRRATALQLTVEAQREAGKGDVE